MKPYFLVALLALGGCASDTSPSVVANTDAAAACRTQFAAGGMTTLQLWQCSDRALLSLERSTDPHDIDLYQAAAADNEAIAARFDVGKLTKTQADAEYDTVAADLKKNRAARREAMESRASNCALHTGTAVCY